MAETSSSESLLARAHFGQLELVLAIFLKVKCHSLLHSSGNKLRLAEVLIFIFSWKNLPVGKIFYFFELLTQNIYIFFSKEGVNTMQILTNMANGYSKMI